MYSLGRVVSTIDSRDRDLRQLIYYKDSNIRKRLWNFPKPALDQGDHPWCGGFSMAHYGICLPFKSDYNFEAGKAFYDRCKEYDLQPGMQNGTSIRSVANVGKTLGMWKSYAFANNVEDIYAYILNYGPVIMGTNWYGNMFLPDSNYIIHCTGILAGGHAWVAIGADLDEEYVDGITTWGPDFGDNGRFRIPMKEFKKLFSEQGEAIAAEEVATVDPTVSIGGCVNTRIGRAIRRLMQ